MIPTTVFEQPYVSLEAPTKELSDKANTVDILCYFVVYFHMDFDLYVNSASIVSLCQ